MFMMGMEKPIDACKIDVRSLILYVPKRGCWWVIELNVFHKGARLKRGLQASSTPPDELRRDITYKEERDKYIVHWCFIIFLVHLRGAIIW